MSHSVIQSSSVSVRSEKLRDSLLTYLSLLMMGQKILSQNRVAINTPRTSPRKQIQIHCQPSEFPSQAVQNKLTPIVMAKLITNELVLGQRTMDKQKKKAIDKNPLIQFSMNVVLGLVISKIKNTIMIVPIIQLAISLNIPTASVVSGTMGLIITSQPSWFRLLTQRAMTKAMITPSI